MALTMRACRWATSTCPSSSASLLLLPRARMCTAATPEEMVQLKEHGDGFVSVVLNRPDVHNAFSDVVIKRLSTVFGKLRQRKDVRGVFLRATGKSFCAGADLEWMKRASEFTREQNVADAVRLSTMLQNLNSLPQPTVALIQGAAFGGGVGLVSCCDIAVAVSSAKFALSEVKLGLIPATISPYVVSKIGAGNARRYFVTAERFDAPKAKEIGLVHEVVDTAEELEEWATTLKQHLMEAAPGAARASKTLVASVANVPITSELINETAERLGEQRMSKEGKEGLAAFFEKRRPAWASA